MQNPAQALEVTVLWERTPLSTALFRDGRITVGPKDGATFLLPEEVLPDEREVAACVGGSWTIAVPKQGARFGAFTVFARLVEDAATAPRKKLDRTMLPWLGGSAAFYGMMLTLLMLQPPEASALSLSNEERVRSNIAYIQAVIERTPQPPAPGHADRSSTDAHANHETSAESGQSTPKPGPKAKGAHPAAPHGPASMADARNAGILGALASMGQSSDVDSSYTALAALLSDKEELGVVDGSGTKDTGGLDMKGTGVGTCSKPPCGDGPIAARLSTRGGHGDEFGWGDCNPPGGCALRFDRESHTPSIRALPPILAGSLAAEQIRRVMNLNRNKFAFCYEQSLRTHPDLAGRVTVQFIIRPDGAVGSAQVLTTDLHDEAAESCITEATGRLSFPASEGVTSVTYPFLFSRP